MLIIVAIIMWLAERVSQFMKPLPRHHLTDAMTVGVLQAFAVIPGVSRSGITITGGLFRNFTREAAARFSFLLSTPIIAGAALLKLHHVMKEGLPPGMATRFLGGHDRFGDRGLRNDCLVHSIPGNENAYGFRRLSNRVRHPVPVARIFLGGFSGQ